MTFQPPPRPWKKGKQDGYSSFTLEVQVCGDSSGRVWSYHDYQSREDEETALRFPYAGTQQIAYALLTEAYRREVFVDALVELTKNPLYLEAYRNGDSEARKHIEDRLAEGSQEVMRRTLAKMGSDVSKEILAMLLESM
jgi:hypothetical protein